MESDAIKSPGPSIKIKWTRPQTLKFVQEYVKYGCLYNSNCSETKGNKYSRKEALKKLAESMNLPDFGPKEAYAKVRNLRSTYSQEIKKLSMRNAGSDDFKYESNLIWFKTLDEALKAADNEISRENKYYDHKMEFFEESDEYADTQSLHKIEVDHYDENFDQITFKTEVCSNEEDNDEDVDEQPVETKETCKRKRKDNDISQQFSNFVDADNSQLTENEFDAFGRSIAAQLKNMSLKDALEAEMYIQNYLSNVRLQQLSQ